MQLVGGWQHRAGYGGGSKKGIGGTTMVGSKKEGRENETMTWRRIPYKIRVEY